MRQTLVKLLVILSFLCNLSACNNDDIYTKKQWLKLINEKMEISSADYLQNLFDFEILEKDYDYNPESPLTNDFVFYTLSNLTETDLIDLEIKLEDNNKKTNKEDADLYLEKCIEYVNNKNFTETKYDIEYSKNIVDENFYFDSDKLYSEYNAEEGSIIYKDDNYFVIDKKKKLKDKYQYDYHLADFEDIISKADIQSSFNLDLSTIEILDDDSVEVEEDLNRIYFQNLGNVNTYRQLQRNGFEIYYSISNSSFHISVAKEVEDGIKVFGEYDINNIKPNIKWDYDKGIKEAYFRIDYNTQQKLGTKTSKYYDRYLDIKSIKDGSALDSLENSFKTKQDLIKTSIPILKFRAPVPNCPMFYLTMELKVHIYASGRIELSLSSVNNTGLEIKNNNFRLINNYDNDIDFIIKASSACTLSIDFSLTALNYKLADIEAEAGAKGYLQTIIHLYDNESYSNIKSDIPPDLIDYISEDNEDISICADINLYWLLNFKFNSADSLLGRLGFYKKYTILDKNNPIINDKYLQDWKFVDKCTFKKSKDFSNENIETTTDRIIPDTYHLLMKENDEKTIKIKGIPEGYSEKDLIYESENTEVAILDYNLVKAKKSGAVNIIIKTSDDKYKASVAVLVQHN